MKKQYREPPSRQTLLLPPSLEDWLPEGHLARFVMDVVDEIDLGPIESRIQAKDPRGTRPYSPQMMVALLFYAYATGRFSSRRIARGCVEDVALRLISRDTQPHFTSIADFRRVHLKALAGLFKEVLRLCREAGLVRGVDVWVDGTKVKANASKHKAMSYAGMQEREERLGREIDELLRQAEAADAAEDTELGEGRDESDGAAAEIKRRETRKEWIRRAREALEKEAKEARAAEPRELARANNHTEKDDPSDRQRDRTRAENQIQKADALDAEAKEPAPPPTEDFPEHAPPTTPDGVPKPEAQRNFTDSDSKIMKNGQGAFEQAFNAQVVVDESYVILATGVTNMAADTPHVPVMLARTTDALGRAPGTFTADNGYYSEDNVLAAVAAGVQPYFALGRERRTWPPLEAAAGAPPEDDAKAWMAWHLKTKRGRERMRLRKSKVELIFGCIKQAMGFRQFLLRGISKVRAEWDLVCIAYNLRKLHAAVV
jgi:transposase